MIFKHANLFTGLNIENLSGSVAASCNIFAVVTKSNTANDTFVVERVDEVDIKDSLHLRIEDGVPILASLLVVGSHSINLKVAKCVSHSRCMRPAHSTVVGSRVANLRRSRTSRVGNGSINLGGCRTADSTWRTTNTPSTWTG